MGRHSPGSNHDQYGMDPYLGAARLAGRQPARAAHTHASQLIASGIDVLTISRRLGHGSPTITLGVYGHLFTTNDQAADVIERAFGKVLAEENAIENTHGTN